MHKERFQFAKTSISLTIYFLIKKVVFSIIVVILLKNLFVINMRKLYSFDNFDNAKIKSIIIIQNIFDFVIINFSCLYERCLVMLLN